MNLSLAAAILDINLKGPTATFDEQGLSVVRGAWEAAKAEHSALIERVKVLEEAWRPEVRAFADLMEAKLRENDHKPGWKEDHPEDLLRRLYEEADEVRRSWGHWRGTMWPREKLAPIIGAECADVANFAMMIADVCGALSNATGREGDGVPSQPWSDGTVARLNIDAEPSAS